MRVATRRQRAAWRVFGEAFRAGRTKRYRRRPARDRRPARRGARPGRPARGGRRLPRRPAGRRAARARAAARAPGASHREDARVLLMRELDSDRYRRWVDDYLDFVRTEGAAVAAGRAGPAASRPRHRAVADLGRRTSRCAATSRSCAGPTSRRSTTCASPASGCATRSSSCARRSAPEAAPAHRPGDGAAGPPRPDERRRRHGLDGADVPRRARRRPQPARERRHRPLPGRPRTGGRAPAPDDRGALARRRRGSASGARSGGWSPGSRTARGAPLGAASRGRARRGGRARSRPA